MTHFYILSPNYHIPFTLTSSAQTAMFAVLPLRTDPYTLEFRFAGRSGSYCKGEIESNLRLWTIQEFPHFRP